MKKIFVFLFCALICISSCSKEKKSTSKERYNNIYNHIIEKENNVIMDLNIEELDFKVNDKDKNIYYYRAVLILNSYFYEYICYYEYVDFLNGDFSIKLLRSELRD